MFDPVPPGIVLSLDEAFEFLKPLKMHDLNLEIVVQRSASRMS